MSSVVHALVTDAAAPALDLALAARGLVIERTGLEQSGSDGTWLIDATLTTDEALSKVIERAVDVIVIAPLERASELSTRHGTRIVLLLADTPAPLISDHIALAIERRLFEVDGLTRVLCKRALWQRVELRLSGEGPHSLVNVDLDHFKRINDEHGHLAGDAVLRSVAHRLDVIVRELDPEALLGRYGGEEFSIYAPLAEAPAMELAERVLEAVRSQPCADIAVTISAGVASSVLATDPMSLMQAADEALYAAKAAGRDRVITYGQLTQNARERDRDVALDAFETRTRVIAERVAEAITARGRRLFDRLKEQADVDPVTALFTRGYLDRRLGFELEQAAEERRPVTVALIDIDHFGKVNKEYGWPTGDRALRHVADAVQRTVRADDKVWVARYGGEELCVVMLGIGIEDAGAVLERIRKAVAITRITSTDGRDFQLTVSIGAASTEGGDGSVIESASGRLLEAKRAGRNRTVS